MGNITLGQNYNELKSLVRKMGDGDKVRGRIEADGSVTLYGSDKGKSLIKFKARADKRANATAFLTQTVENLVNKTHALHRKEVKGKLENALKSAIDNKKEITGADLKAFMKDVKVILQNEKNKLGTKTGLPNEMLKTLTMDQLMGKETFETGGKSYPVSNVLLDQIQALTDASGKFDGMDRADMKKGFTDLADEELRILKDAFNPEDTNAASIKESRGAIFRGNTHMTRFATAAAKTLALDTLQEKVAGLATKVHTKIQANSEAFDFSKRRRGRQGIL